MLKNKVKSLSEKFHKDTIALRRHIHQNPELSYQEVETGKFISEQLKEMGIPNEHGMAKNGVVAHIRGIKGKAKGRRKVVALRADIDALPIIEANKVSYKSKNEGVMHACGHDVHSSSLLGTARILNGVRDQFDGTIKLIFQPAEEKLPGGASIMIAEGVLEKPKPASIFGQHVNPSLEVGKIGMRAGMYMASADELYLTVNGKGGHGALPHYCIDPILITSHLIVALQQIVSRNGNPTVPSVLTFGKINSSGGATNIIPSEVKLMGTFRTMDEKWRMEAHNLMKKMVKNMAKAMGGTAKLNITVGYPYLINDEVLTTRARKFSEAYLGVENVVNLPIRMTAEDFSYYSQKMPACCYRLGTGNIRKGITSPVHTNTFDVDEDCLKLSTGLMAWLAIQELSV